MAGRGPAPKPERSRPNDTARRQAEMTTLAADGERRGPDLPAGIAWHEQTRRWWDTWRVSAIAQTMHAEDWDFMLDTAVLHNDFWQGETKHAAELRLRVAKFGASPEDRMRLKMQIDTEAVKPEARKASVSKRRDHLLKVVAGGTEEA